MRLDNSVLRNSKPKNSWQDLTISILLVLKSFIKNRLIVKSSDAIWDLLSSQTYSCQPAVCLPFCEQELTADFTETVIVVMLGPTTDMVVGWVIENGPTTMSGLPIGRAD